MSTATAIHLDSVPLDHERVVLVTGQRSGLTIIVAVHSTVLGQALGGARMWSYAHWTDALTDALRLSEGMTFKNAAAGLARGGGKSVVCIPAGTTLTEEQKRDAMLDLGDAVESLGGSYMTAEDVGTSAELMSGVAERTAHVCGLPADQGGAGEPADATSEGVHASILATLDALFGSKDVAGRSIVISGLGQVGGRLATRLAAEGANLTVTDVNLAKKEFAESLGATWIDADDAASFEADIFVPCGLGGVLTSDTIKALKVKAVCGAANNQLADHGGAAEIAARGILWAPDFVVNGGGVIYLDMTMQSGADAAAVSARVTQIGDVVATIFRDSAAKGITTLEAAEQLAAARLSAA